MKTLLKTLVLGVMLFGLTASYANTANKGKERSSNRTEITKIYNPKVLVHKNVKYYRNNGIWYIKKNKRYVATKAPIGARINSLPSKYKKVNVRGVKYYTYKGVYYKKSNRGYIIVKI